MKKAILWRLPIFVVGIFTFMIAFVSEIDGTPGFLMLTIGATLIIVSIPFRGLIELMLP